MPTFAEQVTHGVIPGAIAGLALVEDEVDITMKSTTRSGTATKSNYRDSDGNTSGLIYNDHVFTLALEGDLVGDGGTLTAGSLPKLYAGSAAPTLSTWPGAISWFGHSFSDGSTVMEDPQVQASSDVTEAPTFSCNIVNHPWCVTP